MFIFQPSKYMKTRIVFSFVLFLFLNLGLQANIPSSLGEDVPASIAGADTVCFNLENTLVHTYLENAAQAYHDGIGRNGVSLLNYRELGAEAAPYIFLVVEHDYDLPNWAEQTGTVSVVAKGATQVLVSPDSKFQSGTTLSIPVVSDTARIFNLIPDRVYWYRALNGSKKILKKGIVKTTGQVRMIRTQKVNNVRDMGGWPCLGGGHLAYGKIYRGAKLNGFDEEIGTAVDSVDIATLVDFCGIGADLDYRNNGLQISPLGCEIQNINMSAYMYLLTNTNNKGATQNYYSELSNTLKYIATKLEAGQNIYMHCSLGADRTGSVAAILEAICGVSEADIVKDWELTSFSSMGQFKYIDIEENSYYHYENGKLVRGTAEMRSMFKYWYDNYGGANGATIEQQVVAWLKAKVFKSETDLGASVIQRIKDQLVEPDYRGALLVMDLSSKSNTDYYSVSEEETKYFTSQECIFVNANTGQESASDVFNATDYIDCRGYSHLFVNATIEHTAAFYDANHKYIGGSYDSSIATKYGSDATIFKNKEFDIPQGAAYVRLNMPRLSGWSAVLSTRSYM